jgi:hypothetical protein
MISTITLHHPRKDLAFLSPILRKLVEVQTVGGAGQRAKENPLLYQQTWFRGKRLMRRSTRQSLRLLVRSDVGFLIGMRSLGMFHLAAGGFVVFESE